MPFVMNRSILPVTEHWLEKQPQKQNKTNNNKKRQQIPPKKQNPTSQKTQNNDNKKTTNPKHKKQTKDKTKQNKQPPPKNQHRNINITPTPQKKRKRKRKDKKKKENKKKKKKRKKERKGVEPTTLCIPASLANAIQPLTQILQSLILIYDSVFHCIFQGVFLCLGVLFNGLISSIASALRDIGPWRHLSVESVI